MSKFGARNMAAKNMRSGDGSGYGYGYGYGFVFFFKQKTAYEIQGRSRHSC